MISNSRSTTCELCEKPRGQATSTALAGPPRLIRCDQCSLVSLEEFPADDIRSAQYQENYYDPERGERFPLVFEWMVRFFRWGRMRAILSREPGPAALLDIGSGRSVMIHMFQQRGWRGLGTQVSETAARAARKLRGVEVSVGELPEIDLEPESFRVITFYHVLEHITQPLRYLRKSWELLEDGGLLVVEVPNFSSPGFRLLGLRNLCLDYPNHLFFFTPSTLRSLLQKAGFVIEEESHFSLEYSTFTTLQNILNFLPGRPSRLYYSFHRNPEGRRLARQPLTWLHGLLAGLLAPLALLISLMALVLPIGNTLRMYCRKTG